MNEEARAFGYLCPECGKTVVASRDAFTLAASDAAIACECGGAVLRTYYDGQRYQISVPCGLCGGSHTAVCTPEQMLHGALALSCTKTGQFSCFIGPPGTVEQKTKELSILAEKERQDDGETAFLDNVIMYEVLSELKDIAARPDGITCRCGGREWRMQIRRASVDLICAACGGRLRIPAATDRDLDDLCCHMKLVIPGAKA
ncbi:MAG: hypothetical protein IJR48_04920 [Oscillibacter sp.]|nr:hypothetical protein [Oscillibacter sp.]